METPPSNLTSSVPSILDPSHPLAYLAYLPPSVAYETLVVSYVLVASLSVLIWDIISTLVEEYRILVKCSPRLSWFVYWTTRLSTVGFLLFSTIYETAPLGNCKALFRINPSLFSLSVASTSFLFYLRVYAMYKHNKYVCGFFFVMWLAVFGCSLTPIFGSSGLNIGPTKHCEVSESIQQFIGVNSTLPLVNDTLIFIAIWYRLVQIGLLGNARARDVVKAALSGQSMTVFTRAFFRDGQAYYLSTASLAFVAMVIFHLDSVPLIYRCLFPSINLTLINIMACRVYRNWASGKYKEGSNGGPAVATIDCSLPTHFARPPTGPPSLTLVRSQSPETSRLEGVTFIHYSVPDERVWTA